MWGWETLLLQQNKLAFSFARISAEPSAGTTGQLAGLGQGSMLREALQKKEKKQKEKRNKDEVHVGQGKYLADKTSTTLLRV